MTETFSETTEMLYNQLPRVFRNFDEQTYLKRYLDILTRGGFDLAKEETHELLSLIDFDKIPDEYLALLGEKLGYRYIPEFTPQFQRILLSNIASIYRRKGTKGVILFVARELAQFDVEIEMLERPKMLRTFSETREPTKTFDGVQSSFYTVGNKTTKKMEVVLRLKDDSARNLEVDGDALLRFLAQFVPAHCILSYLISYSEGVETVEVNVTETVIDDKFNALDGEIGIHRSTYADRLFMNEKLGVESIAATHQYFASDLLKANLELDDISLNTTESEVLSKLYESNGQETRNSTSTEREPLFKIMERNTESHTQAIQEMETGVIFIREFSTETHVSSVLEIEESTLSDELRIENHATVTEEVESALIITLVTENESQTMDTNADAYDNTFLAMGAETETNISDSYTTSLVRLSVEEEIHMHTSSDHEELDSTPQPPNEL